MIFEFITPILIVIASMMTLLFGLSILVRRNDIADIAWGIGIFVVALVSYRLAEPASVLSTVLLLLAGLWGGRLSLRILLRNRKKPEDYRYRKWREEWGRWFYPRSFLQVYMLQGALMLVVGYSFIHAGLWAGPDSFGPLQVVGLLVWLVGYIFEVVGDWQLDRFLARPECRGQILQTGLWRYSRHPNYFGEITMWWGIWLMVAPLPFGYLALISPVVITWLIVRVSGIPLLEQKMAANPQFADYKRRTSVLIPLPPKSR